MGAELHLKGQGKGIMIFLISPQPADNVFLGTKREALLAFQMPRTCCRARWLPNCPRTWARHRAGRECAVDDLSVAGMAEVEPWSRPPQG